MQGKLRWNYEFRRIKFTLSKKKREKLLGAIEKHNNDLQNLLGSSDKLAPTRHIRKTSASSLVPTFQKARDQAYSLFAVLTSAWRCECQPFHNTFLQLEHRSVAKANLTEPTKFRVLFNVGQGQRPGPKRWNSQETDIKISEEQRPSLPSRHKRSSTSIPQTPVINSRPSSSPLAYVSFQFVKVTRTFEGTILLTCHHRSPRTSKKVSFQVDDVPQSPVDTKIVIDDGSTEILDLCTAMEEKEPKCLGFLLDKRKRRYVFHSVHQPQKAIIPHETISLESLLSRKPWDKSAATERLTLSRHERVFVAVALASSLLQIHTTPWLGETWSKRDVYFLRASKGSKRPIVLEQVYLAPPKTPEEAAQSPSTLSDNATHDHTKAVFALGVMLLELCFGKLSQSDNMSDRTNHMLCR